MQCRDSLGETTNIPRLRTGSGGLNHGVVASPTIRSRLHME